MDSCLLLLEEFLREFCLLTKPESSERPIKEQLGWALFSGLKAAEFEGRQSVFLVGTCPVGIECAHILLRRVGTKLSPEGFVLGFPKE